jgi:hypothetical protein
LRVLFLVEKMGAKGYPNMKTHIALLTSVLLAACGSDALDPGEGSDPGGGTNTLYVEGRASAEPRIVNATANDFDTEFSIDLSLNGAPVTTGTVTITSRFATTPLSFIDTSNGQGRWEGRAGGYDQSYQLDVKSGTDEVTGVIVDGPDLHRITGPAAGATLDSTVATNLTWDREDGAQIITFRSDAVDRITITDSGSYSMGPGVLKAEKDQTRENRLELRRTNHIAPHGAIGGSDFAVSVEQYVDVIAQPDPTL